MTVVSQPVVEIRGDYSSLNKALNDARTKVGNFASYIEQASRKIQGSFSNIEFAAGQLDYKLGLLNTNINTKLLVTLRTLGADAFATAGELKALKAEATDANTEMRALTAAARGQSAMFRQSINSVLSLTTSLGALAAQLSRVQTLANRPINVRQTVTKGGLLGGGGYGAGFTALMAGGAILSGIGSIIKSGMDTEDAVRRVMATAGDPRPYQVIRKEVLGIAEQFGQLPVEVANSLYTVESAGMQGARGLEVLTTSAEMARGTMTPLKDTTDLLTKTLVTFRLNVDKSSKIADIYTRAIKDSLRPGEEFVPALENVSEIAKSGGLSIEEYSAALATLTQTTKSATTASTFLKNFINGLINPTSEMRKAAKAAGLEWLAMGHGAEYIRKMGFDRALNDISKATNNNVTAMDALFPDMRKNQSILSLLNDGGRRFEKTLNDMRTATGAVAAANKVMDSSASQAARDLNSAWMSLESNVESALAPSLIKLFKYLEEVINDFNRLPSSTQDVIAKIIALVGAILSIGGAIKVASAAMSGFGIDVAASLGAGGPVLLAIGLTAAAVLLIKQNWDAAKEAHDDYVQATTNNAKSSITLQQIASSSKSPAIRIIAEQNLIKDQMDAISKELNYWEDVKAGKNVALKPNGDTIYEAPNYTGNLGNDLNTRIEGLSRSLADQTASYNRLEAARKSYGQSYLASHPTASLPPGIDKDALGHASCAIFASEYLNRHGVSISKTASAPGLVNEFIKAGAQRVPASMAEANDLIVWRGSKYGAIQPGGKRSGYHVGVGLGGGKVIQDSEGRIGTRSASDASYALRLPQSFYDLRSTPVPGSENIPGWVSQVQAGKKKQPGFMSEVPSDAFSKNTTFADRVKSLEDYVKGIGNAATKSGILSKETQELARVQKMFEDEAKASGRVIDQHALNIALDTVKLLSFEKQEKAATSAIKDGTSELRSEVPVLKQREAAYEAARNKQQRYYDTHHGRLSSPQAKADYLSLSRGTRDAEKSAATLADHMYRLMNNTKAAVSEQERLTNEINNTKAAIQEQLKASRDAQESLEREIASAVRGVTPKEDVLDRQKEVLQRAADMETALEKSGIGGDLFKKLQGDIQTYQAGGLGQIMSQVNAQARKSALDLQKFMLDTGRETLLTYQGNIRSMLSSMVDQFTSAGYADEGLAADIETLANELYKAGWQDVDDELTNLKEALDEGDISAKEYISSLQQLMTLPGFRQSPEYAKTVSALDAQYKKESSAQQTQADKIGKEIGEPLAQAMIDEITKKSKKLQEALREVVQKALEDSVKSSTEKLVSGFALKYIQKKSSIPQRTEADKQMDATNKFDAAVGSWNTGVVLLQSIMNRFIGALQGTGTGSSSAGSPGSGGSTGPGSGTSAPSGPGIAAAVARAAGSAGSLARVGGNPTGTAFSDVSGLGANLAALFSNKLTSGSISGYSSMISSFASFMSSPGSASGIGSALGMVKGATGFLSGIGQATRSKGLTSFLGAASPYLALAGSLLALGTLFGGSGKKTPDLTRSEVYDAAIASLGATVNSGYSGQEGVRQLLGGVSTAAAGVHGFFGQNNTPLSVGELHVHAHGITDPTSFAKTAAPMVAREIARSVTLDNARRGGGYNVG